MQQFWGVSANQKLELQASSDVSQKQSSITGADPYLRPAMMYSCYHSSSNKVAHTSQSLQFTLTIQLTKQSMTGLDGVVQ